MRNRLDDVAGKRLWTDPELDGLINEAYFEAAERSLIIVDTITLRIRAGKATYRITGALRIDRVQCAGQRNPLALTSVKDLDREYPGWTARAPGAASWALPVEDELRFSPIPAEDTTAEVTIRRLPNALLQGDEDEPEIASRLHLRMLDWALHLAYDKRDADAGNQQLAAKYDTTFTESFGERLTAKQQRGRSDARRHATRLNW